jgi:hypothetical protein
MPPKSTFGSCFMMVIPFSNSLIFSRVPPATASRFCDLFITKAKNAPSKAQNTDVHSVLILPMRSMAQLE